MGTDGNGGVPPAIVLAATLSAGGHPGSNLPGRHKEDDENLVVADTLLSGGHSNNPLDENLVIGSEVDEGMARTLVARASGYRMDIESENFVLSTNGTNVGVSDLPGVIGGQHGGECDFVVGTFQQSSMEGRGTVGWDEDPAVAKPVKTQDDGQMIVVASTFNGGEVDGQSPSLVSGDGPRGRSTHNGMDVVVADPMPQGVRRLTPLECERLMGWPDGWTRFAADGHEIPDSHRYRMCGNGVVAPVAEWLGHRLMWLDASEGT